MAEEYTGPVTEVVYVPLKPGTDLESAEIKPIWDAAHATISKQTGLRNVFWGKQAESPDTLQLVQDWDSLAAHAAFSSSPEYGPFMKNMAVIIQDGAHPFLCHLRIPAHEKEGIDPRTAPVTECFTAYFESSQDEQKWAEENWTPFRDGLMKIKGVELTGVMGGYSIEPHKHEKLNGGEGKAFLGFIGWPSVQAHLNFRDSEEAAKLGSMLGTGPTAFAVHHVALTKSL